MGASDEPCSEIYCGAFPESEPETQSVAHFLRSHKDSVKLYITIHSYSQMLLFPYSCTLDEAENHNEMVSVSLSNRSLTNIKGQFFFFFHDGCPSAFFLVFMDEYAFSKLEMVQEASQKIRRFYRSMYKYGAGAKTICKYENNSFEYIHNKQLSFLFFRLSSRWLR